MSDQRLLSTADDDALNKSSTPTPTSPLVISTRTVAIIKPHAVDHRFEIEHRITEGKFEVRLSSSTTPSRKSIPMIFFLAADRKREADGVRHGDRPRRPL